MKKISFFFSQKEGPKNYPSYKSASDRQRRMKTKKKTKCVEKVGEERDKVETRNNNMSFTCTLCMKGWNNICVFTCTRRRDRSKMRRTKFEVFLLSTVFFFFLFIDTSKFFFPPFFSFDIQKLKDENRCPKKLHYRLEYALLHGLSSLFLPNATCEYFFSHSEGHAGEKNLSTVARCVENTAKLENFSEIIDR